MSQWAVVRARLEIKKHESSGGWKKNKIKMFSDGAPVINVWSRKSRAKAKVVVSLIGLDTCTGYEGSEMSGGYV